MSSDDLLEETEVIASRVALIEADALRNVDQRIGLLVSQTPLAFIVWDVEFKVVEWNPASERIFGWSSEEAIGQHASFIVPEKDRPHVHNVFQGLLKQSGGIRSANDNLTKAGKLIHTEWYNAPLLDEHGEVVCVASLCEDVTEKVEAKRALQESEERLRLVLEATGTGTWDWDIVNDFVTWNEQTRSLVGSGKLFGKASDLGPESIHPDDQERVERATAAHLERNEPFVIDIRIRTHQDYRWFLLSGKATRDETGQPVRMLGTLVDIHDRKLAELESLQLSKDLDRRVKDRTRELDMAREELEEMCYAVSHDLRSPLRSIHGFSKAVEEDYAAVIDDTAVEYLQRIQNASLRLDDLLDGLLSMVRVNRIEAVSEPVNLDAFAKEIEGELHASNPEHRVDFIVHEGLSTFGDPRLLRLLLTNLLSNAWKFTIDRPTPRVELGRDDEGTFFVRDNGVGFDMRYSDKLYKPFQKVHSPNQFPGTGIGLAISHRIVVRHGGTIWAEGREGEGATFYFRLS